MRLSGIEIRGFKSFCDPVRISFEDHRIVGIVGPNGCGKSNVVDALRWVLGEQSAKHLRGQDMQDVIFAGSKTRTQSATASVTLFFENYRVPDTGLFKFGSFSEISIGRKLHRDGSSEYLINNTPARLKDIRDIFLDTGVGGKGYSIIEQGMIGRIITSKPEERLRIVEEAAGISKFKVKKQEAFQRLQTSRSNLTRISDLTAELNEREQLLGRQVERAEKYMTAKSVSERLSNHIHAYRWYTLKNKADELNRQITQEEETQKNILGTLAVSETSVERLRIELLQAEDDLENTRRHTEELKILITSRENDIKIREDRLKNLHEWKERQTADIESLTALLAEKSRLSDTENKALETAEAQVEYAEADLQNAEETRRVIKNEEENQRIRTATTGKRLAKIREQLSAAEANLIRLRERSTEYAEELTRASDNKLSEILSESPSAQLNPAEITDIAVLQQQTDGLKEQLEQITADIRQSEADISALTKEQSGYASELTKLTAEEQALRRVMDTYQFSDENIQKTQNYFREHPYTADTCGYLGLLSDLYHPTADIPSAVAALWNMLAGIAVFSSGTRASHISQSLKTAGIGSLTLYFTDSAGELSTDNFLSEESTSSKPLSAYLIPRTVQPTAIPLLKRIICTTDGTQLPSRSHTDIPLFHFNSDTLLTESNGLVRFINPDADPAHTLREQTRRRLSDIPAQTDTLNRHIDSCEVKLAMLRADCDEQQDMQTRVSEELKIISLKLSESRIEKDILKKQYEEQRRRQDQEAKRYTELTQKQAQTLNQTEETARLIAQLNAEADVLTAQHQSDNDTLSNTVERNAQQETHYQELRLQLQEFKNIRSRTAETTARLQADIKEITQKLEDARSGYQKKFTGASEELTSIEKLRAEIPMLLSSYEESAGEAVAQKNTVELKKQEILQAEKDKNIFFEKINRSEKQKQTFSLQLAETTKEMNLTEERLREASGFFPKEVLKSIRPEEFDLSAASRELEEQKEILREIGNINMEAFDEYKTLKERLGFLTGQQKDLTDSISALETSIEQLDAETEAKFQETFARINQNLQTVFPLFFGGGNAKLIMVQDNEDNSKRGIEITALIPGKKLQNMNLMSGGEKALCALALIFAVFLIKPAPFCVLDEVDAPLDEANVKRFSNVLSEFSQKTRFVIITHNKVTMTVADCLLGVTMGEPGVSKIVSVRVSDYVSTPSAVA